MRTVISLFIGLLLGSAALAAHGGTEGGNGGGGVHERGVYMTFYSAGLYVEPQAGSAPQSIPGLDDVMNYISGLSSLSDATKAPILGALVPSPTRNYYFATPSQLTPAVRRGLLAEFSRVTGVRSSRIALYALTDTRSKTTFILPEFMKLSKDDQMAILFHEAYWIVHPNATYDSVVKAGMAFEAALENPRDAAKVFDFTRYVGSPEETFKAKVSWDLSSGSLQGLVRSGPNGSYLSLADLVGEKYMQCQSGNMAGDALSAAGYSHDENCFPYLQMNIRSLIEKHPNSAVLQAFERWFNDSKNSYVFITLSWQLDNIDASTSKGQDRMEAVRDRSKKMTAITWDQAGSCEFLLSGNLGGSACSKERWDAGIDFTGYGCGNVVCSVPRSAKSEEIKVHGELPVDLQ